MKVEPLKKGKLTADLKKEFGGLEIDVGILQNRQAAIPDFSKPPKKGDFGGVSGKKALQAKRNKTSSLSLQDLADKLNKAYKWLTFGIERNKSEDVQRLADGIFNYFKNKQSNKLKEIENLSVAVVRNPIISGALGQNEEKWAKRKGFNWLMVATGTFLKSITAKAIRK